MNEFRDAQKKVSDDFVSYMKKARSPVTGEIEDFEQTLNKWALESIAVVLLDSRWDGGKFFATSLQALSW